MRIYRNVIDKSTWGPGLWQLEPDKVQWTDPTSGLPCLAVRHIRYGNWCGYVGLAEGHPLFGLDWREHRDVFGELEAHQGVNFTDTCDPDAPENMGICHVPEPGQPDQVWWVGFDCGHSWDLQPGMEAFTREVERHNPQLRALGAAIRRLNDESPFDMRDRYRSLLYVRDQCRGLAQQLAERALVPA